MFTINRNVCTIFTDRGNGVRGNVNPCSAKGLSGKVSLTERGYLASKEGEGHKRAYGKRGLKLYSLYPSSLISLVVVETEEMRAVAFDPRYGLGIVHGFLEAELSSASSL